MPLRLLANHDSCFTNKILISAKYAILEVDTPIQAARMVVEESQFSRLNRDASSRPRPSPVILPDFAEMLYSSVESSLMVA